MKWQSATSQPSSLLIIHAFNFVFRQKLDFRLKYMQMVSLVTGDDFLVQYNLTIDTEDFMGYLQNLTWEWHSFAYSSFMGFDDFYRILFAEIVASSGICYNFNMVDAEELFHLDKYYSIMVQFQYHTLIF
jgi:hypothetical protein